MVDSRKLNCAKWSRFERQKRLAGKPRGEVGLSGVIAKAETQQTNSAGDECELKHNQPSRASRKGEGFCFCFSGR
jgi:hypothetical protein